ncbi:MAG: Transcription elongation factor B (SIII), polypeptide 1 (15kDa, elongin C) [Geoglossum simile]|nr:MAG: Transcription elongation factor B (SIII), polypeptide 1 (15kDa, elongin C) [Geoglossum simile]
MTDDASTSEYVTLVSSDGYQFVVKRSAACVSGALKRMLDPKSNFSEAIENKATLENLNGVVLEKVCEYFYFYEKYKDSRDSPDMDIPPEMCLELLMAADYLNA